MSETDLPPPDRPGLYVLGLLRGDERLAFEADMAADSVLAAEVRAWEERLLPLADAIEQVQPDDRVWTAIARVVEPPAVRAAATSTSPSGLRTWLWDNLLVWRAVGAMGIAAAIALAILPRSVPTTSMVAVLSTAHGPVFTVAVRANGAMEVVPVGSEAPPPGKVWQLWAVVPKEKPVSLGLMQGRRLVLPASDIPAQMRQPHTLIAATVEPPGGSPTGQPDFPIVFSGPLLPIGAAKS